MTNDRRDGSGPGGGMMLRMVAAAAEDKDATAMNLVALQPHLATDIDRLVLALVRFFCAAYVTGDAGYWNAALCAADDALGPVDGPAVFGRSCALVLAMRRDRVREFSFLPAPCELACADEVELLAFLSALRGTDSDKVRDRCEAFAGRCQPTRLLIAGTAIVGLCGRIAETCVTCPARRDRRTLN